MNDIIKFGLKVGVVLLGVCFWLRTPAAQAGQAYGELRESGSNSPPFLGQKVQVVTGTSVSLHAAAIAGAVSAFDHVPTPQPVGDATWFPLTINNPARNGPVNVVRRTPPVAYETILKDDTTLSTDVARATSMGTTSTAQAVVTYSAGKDTKGNPTIIQDSTGTFANVVTGRVRGRAAALVDDPIYYGSTPAGSTFSGTVGLTANTSGPDAIVNGPGALVGFLIQGGANLPGASGAIGMSDSGNPLMYSLSIVFTNGDSSPSVLFQTDPELQIFAPGTTTPITDADVENSVKSNFNEVGNNWYLNGGGVLNGTLPLFDYQATLSADVATFQVDDAQGVIAEVPTPEPGTLTLAALGIGLLAAARYGARHIPRRRVPGRFRPARGRRVSTT
jgi:hypothetical protein